MFNSCKQISSTVRRTVFCFQNSKRSFCSFSQKKEYFHPRFCEFRSSLTPPFGLDSSFSFVRRFCLKRFSTRSSNGISCEKEYIKSSSFSTGLLGIEELRVPEGFRILADRAVSQANDLMTEFNKLSPSENTIAKLDEISNTICSVLDLAEFVRNTHSQKDFVQEAHSAVIKLSQYVQLLNVDKNLYMHVVKALTSESQSQLSAEGKRVGNLLKSDFERSGIHLSSEKTSKLNELQNKIFELGMIFGNNIRDDDAYVDIFPSSKLNKVPANIVAMMKRIRRRNGRGRGGDTVEEEEEGRGKGGKGIRRSLGGDGIGEHGFRISNNSLSVSSVLKWVGDEEVRKKVFMLGNSCPNNNFEILNQLVSSRHDLAQIMNFDSYGHYFLHSLMSRSPENVISFLTSMSEKIKEKAKKEHNLLLECKRKYTFNKSKHNNVIHAYDRPFYTGIAKANAFNLDTRKISSYFPINACFEGLCLMTKILFQVEMKQMHMHLGESWAENVLKFTLSHPQHGEIGTLYFDLHPRAGKFSSAAHFTIKCGRKLTEKEHQLPVVAIVCNFATSSPSPSSSSSFSSISPCLLSYHDFETLCHEFGHALHSLLSKTTYQHLSGTRCLLDYVEIPSNLFEYFASDYRFLRLFAKDHSTGEAIPEQLVKSLNQSKHMFSATDLQYQIVYSLLDQELFSRPPSKKSSSEILEQVQNEHCLIKYVQDTHWQTRFSHLVNYGAGYYSYLFAKSYASQLWDSLFDEHDLSPAMGLPLWDKMLRFGGAKDPAEILKDLVGEKGITIASDGGVVPCDSAYLKEIGI